MVFEGNTRPIMESNPGYKICDWYISAKYESLKQEILNTTCCDFDIDQWKSTEMTAKTKLNEWNKDPDARKLLSQHTDPIKCWERLYGIKRNTPITVEHIMSLLFYTNYSAQSYLFSGTYRRVDPFESDRLLKNRHSQVAIWGRLLRETVEAYGLSMSKAKHIRVFYHGVGKTLLFSNTSIYLNGPVSTTIGMLFVLLFLYLSILYFNQIFISQMKLWLLIHLEQMVLFLKLLILPVLYIFLIVLIGLVILKRKNVFSLEDYNHLN